MFPACRFAWLRLFSDILDVLQMGLHQAAIVLGCFRCVAVRSEYKGCPGQCSGGIVAACGLRISDRDLQIAMIFEKMFIP